VTDFPTGFFWGSATAAHQVEGGNTNNDWWDWEHDPSSAAVESSGDGIDQWHRYDDDFALLASLGQNAHRFSLEWSRIEPAPGEFSRAAIEHYKRVLESLHGHGLTPFATLFHFTLPRWFAQRGGWLADDALDLFGRYVEKVGATLGDLMPYVCTINEPQIVSLMSYGVGDFPPGEQNMAKAVRANQVLAAAHRTAVAAMRSGTGSPKLGTALQLPSVQPLRPGDEADEAAAARMDAFAVETHLADLRTGGDVGDFVGLQYYTRMLCDASKNQLLAPAPEGAETSMIGWELYPAGFGEMLRRLADVGLPIVVTENGIATAEDSQRVRYLDLHLRELKAAMDDGVDVRGYFYWSSFDNFEWSKGYMPRFGLIGIDRENGLRRVVNPSAVVYGEVARTGSLKVLAEAARAVGEA
jgi:beta-glucosidase